MWIFPPTLDPTISMVFFIKRINNSIRIQNVYAKILLRIVLMRISRSLAGCDSEIKMKIMKTLS